jgi:hypothetical protein
MLTSSTASAQSTATVEAPGFFDFAALTGIYGEPRVMINLSPTLLRLMAVASKQEPEAAALMSSLEGVRVNVYSTAGQPGPALAQAGSVKQRLSAEGWEPVVQVVEPDEFVQIFTKTSGNEIEGLVVMAVDAEEAVFLNIRGNIDPSKLGTVMEQLDIDSVDMSDAGESE